MLPAWIMAIQAAQKIAQNQNNNNNQQQPIVNGQRQNVQFPQMNSSTVFDIYNALIEDEDEKKKKNEIGM